jgi:cytoskeletal protein RodZ
MQWTGKIRRWRWLGLCALLFLLVCGSAVAQTDTSTPPTKPAQTSATPAPKAKPHTTTHTTAKHTPAHKSTAHTTAKSKSARGKKVTKKRGQQAIDSERARQIQTALIREHYMQGEPSGTWDSATQAAMQRYQADQGWQSKTTPDARALIKLGLGPSSDHLLNPESAMTTSIAPAEADPKARSKPAPPGNNIPQQ